MDKKDLKFYVTPSQEIVEVELKGQLLAGSTNAKGVEEDEWDDEEG